MRHKFISAAILGSLLALTSMAEAKKEFSAPTGKKVASGKQFDIYVELKESKPFATSGLMLNIYRLLSLSSTPKNMDSNVFPVAWKPSMLTFLTANRVSIAIS